MSDRPHCLWESPDGQTAIYLSFDVVDAINAAILEAASAAPLRGAEVGGLLLGKAEKRARWTVWVDRIELLPCRYSRGPSFYLEAEDAPDLTRPEIAGYFRSHTRKDLFLGPGDMDLLTTHFARPEQVALLVKPFQSRPNLAGFFVWKDGKIAGSSSPREFPFHRRELGGGESVPQPPTPTVRKPYAEQNDVPETVPAESQRRPILLWALLAILATAATGSIGYLLFERTKPISVIAARSNAPGLRLGAFEGQRNVTLTWDKDSPTIASALRGVIEIQEATFRKTLELGPEQLHGGKIIYSRPVAIADTVSFSFRVFPERGKPASESVQMVSNRPLDSAGEPLPHLPRRAAQVSAQVEPKRKEQTKPIAPKTAELAKPETPRVETPKLEAPKVETPKVDAPVVPLRPAPRRIPEP